MVGLERRARDVAPQTVIALLRMFRLVVVLLASRSEDDGATVSFSSANDGSVDL